MMLRLLRPNGQLVQAALRSGEPSFYAAGLGLRQFSTKGLGPETYSGPYTEEQVKELEKFAFTVARDHLPSKKLVDPWLRAKLGPFYAEGWQQRVVARAEEDKREQRRAQRPSDSTHFTVTHPVDQSAPAGKELSANDMFAVIGLAGTQFKVVSGDVVICNKLPGAEVGTKIELTDVLMIGTRTQTLIGRPNVPNYVVTAFVEQQAKEKKQLAFYKKPKTYSQKVRGFRRSVTILRIADILLKPANSSSAETEANKST